MEGFKYILIIVLMIVILSTAIYNHRKAKAMNKVYSPFIERPIYQKINSSSKNNEYIKILDMYSEYYNCWNLLKYYSIVYNQAIMKFNISKKWKFDNVLELKEKIVYFKDKYNDVNQKINSMEKLIATKEEKYLSFFPTYKNNELISLFFEETIHGYENNENNNIVLFFEDLVFKISDNLKSFEIYNISELTTNFDVKYIRKSHTVSKNDYIKSISWFHSRKDGDRDLRYKNNYKIYTVVETYFYFSEFPTIKLLFRDYLKGQELKNILNRYKGTYKLKNRDEVINDAKTSMSNADQNRENIYVTHPTFGYGELISKSQELLTINFINYGKKQISSKYTQIKYIDKKDYINEKEIAKKTTENSYHTGTLMGANQRYNSIEEGDFVNHKSYGLSEVLEILNDYYILRIIDGSKKTIRKYYVDKLLHEGEVYKKNELQLTIGINDYVYNGYYGYGQVILINSDFIVILWKNNSNVQEFEKKYVYYLTKINENKVKEINLSVEINDVIEILPYKDRNNFGIVKKINGSIVEYLDLKQNKNFLSDIKDIRITNHEIVVEYFTKYLKSIDLHNYIKVQTRREYYTKEEYHNLIRIALQKASLINTEILVDQMITKLSYQYIKNVNGIYLNPKFGSLEDYIRLRIYKEDLYYYDYNMDSQSYKYILNKLCNEKLIVKTDSDAYITTKKMNDLKIFKSSIVNYENKVKAYLEEHKFITIGRIKELIDKKLKKILINDQTIINFINTFDDLKNYIIGGHVTFVLKSSQLKSEYFESALIEFMKSDEILTINIYDIISKLNDYFGFSFDIKSFTVEAKKFQILFYSEETEKLYYKKEYYYNEVFK